MLDVKKKQTSPARRKRWVLLACEAAILLILCIAWVVLDRPAELPDDDAHITYREVAVHEAKDVARLGITLRSGESWAAVQTEEGKLSIEGDAGYEVDAANAADMLNAAKVISYEDVLSDDPAEFRDHLADFGLDVPRVVADITYADGSRWTLRIGDVLHLEEENAYYMMIDGDERLFSLDKGTAETLMTQKALLHPVTQPTLHKARFDKITFGDGAGNTLAEWTLQGAIGGNAQDRWMMTAPVQYPAEGESMATLQANLANVRLGAYVGEATPENLAAYGFDAPCFVLSIHQAAGSIGTTGLDGVYSVTDWPEDTFTLTVGNAKSDAVDYVLVGEKIYISSHFSLNVFMEMDVLATLSRYTVPVALGNLHRLTVRTGAQERVYTITRTEQVDEGNALVTDSEGNVLYDRSCELNGSMLAYAKFEAAYNELLKISVSGNLPEGWTAEEPAHTTFIFEAFSGESYTLELVPFDAMHDAVLLDGNALFYLIKHGMDFDVI